MIDILTHIFLNTGLAIDLIWLGILALILEIGLNG